MASAARTAQHLRHGTPWDPELLTDLFGIDLERYIPEVVLTIGKSTGPATERYRYTATISSSGVSRRLAAGAA